MLWVAELAGLSIDYLGIKGKKWHLKNDGEPGFIFARPRASGLFFVHAQALFLVESDRNLVWHFKPEVVTSGQFYFTGRPKVST